MRYFTGDPKNRPKDPNEIHKDSPEREPYIPSKELTNAVNLSIFLKRPLLLEGEAGCGKTRLASAVAHELGYPLYRWNIRSTTRYQEGLYEYDALMRLHDVNLQKGLDGKTLDGQRTANPRNVNDYLEFKELGQAFRNDCPSVVLIDEIDKADLDFPNDLLALLEKPYEFRVRETGKTITANYPPIVIITSNKEKGNLPAPFLRRCVYYFIEFPQRDDLKKIVTIHFQQMAEQAAAEAKPAPSADLVDAALDEFLAIRGQKGLTKLPGTSEFLDWLGALAHFEDAPYSAEALKTKADKLPYKELLFKLRGDWRRAGFAASS